MAKNDNLKDFLTDIADVIREKKGTTDLINPQNFSAEIASIQSGGGAVAVSAKAVNFRDYDGTILHSYTKDEFLALTELPPLPTREGLICQEWNWDYADAVEYVTAYGVLEVGATYITDDGKTRLYITIAAEGRMDVPLYFSQSVANGVTIDWGDGSATETLSGTGNKNTTHHYNAIGDYVISLEVADGCTLGLGHASSSYCVMGSTGNNARVYCCMLRKAEIGKGLSSLSNYAFHYCYCLKSVTTPKSVTYLGDYLFEFCYSLIFATLPSGITKLPYNGFYYCAGLDFVSIPNGIPRISNSIFKGCYSLRRTVIPQSVSIIESYAFQNCFNLSSLVIPQSVTEIEGSSFAGCYNLTSIVLPNSLKTITQNFSANYSIASFVLPSELTTIRQKAFENCYGVAFYDFSATLVVPTMISTDAFTNIPSDCKIIVPDALYDTWIAATNWSTYASQTIKKSEWDALNA